MPVGSISKYEIPFHFQNLLISFEIIDLHFPLIIELCFKQGLKQGGQEAQIDALLSLISESASW